MPEFEPVQEIRFAVVMYGGVSLAIYMNGVTAELYRMVRATAPARGLDGAGDLHVKKPESTESIYREMAQRLLGGAPGGPVRTRFVIDILSGTSAGGINAIYLSKALVNDARLEHLKQLWLDEADISRLINDGQALQGLPLTEHEPNSLLSGKRMYLKLLQAFRAMSEPQGPSPFVDDLDLFVTATDLRGSLQPLAQTGTWERRHKARFRFNYRRDLGENQFTRAFDPMLAFAARCTSAFPVAFEPMRLEDIDEAASAEGALGSSDPRWKPFFSTGEQSQDDYRTRSFADGGYLENKPFSHAIDELRRRSPLRATHRKLLYIEPSPEHPEDTAPSASRFDVLQNLVAVFSLPRQENIREQIERVEVRNQLVERLDRVMEGMEKDVRAASAARSSPIAGVEWAKKDVATVIGEMGVAYGGYHRLKLAVVTDEIAHPLRSAWGYESDPIGAEALRLLVRVWRARNYHTGVARDGKETETRFLMDFDISYRIRRLSLVLFKAKQLLDERERSGICESLGLSPDDVTEKDVLDLQEALGGQLARLIRFRKERCPLRPGGPLLSGIASQQLVQEQRHAARLAQAEKLLVPGVMAELQAGIGEYSSRLIRVLVDVGDRCIEILPERAPNAAASALAHYYRHFDDYDAILFPVQHSLDLGETDRIDVVRISPEDSVSIIDARAERRQKLAGERLFHFGAFFDRRWRASDLLWGRLDGAERIISAILAGDDEAQLRLRTDLVRRAQVIILREELGAAQLVDLSDAVVKEMKRLRSAGDKRDPEELARAAMAVLAGERWADAMLSAADSERIIERFRKEFGIPDLEPGPVLEEVARASSVISTLLQGLSLKYQKTAPAMAAVTRLLSGIWVVLELLVPRPLGALLLRYWTVLPVLCGVLIAVAGWALQIEPALRIGAILIVAGLFARLMLDLARSFMRQPTLVAALTGAGSLLAAALLLLALLGLVEIEVHQPLADVRTWVLTHSARK